MGVTALGDLFGPVAEAAHELTVVVRVAGGEVEMTVGGDRPGRAGRHAQLAFQARVVLDGPGVFADLGVDEDGAEQDEVAELGVDDVAVNTHLAEPRRDGDRLVRDDPRLPRELVHLHGKAHRGIDGAHAHRLQLAHHVSADLVGVVARVMELQIGHRARGSADVLPVHAGHDADQRADAR